MPDTLHAALTPEELDQLISDAEHGGVPLPTGPINSHIHLPPNFSAFSSVNDVIEVARSEKIIALGTSNYYDFSVYAEFAKQANIHGITPIMGLEIIARDDQMANNGTKVNDPGNPGKIYICGKGINRHESLSEKGREILDKIRNNDGTRMARMLALLCEVLSAKGLPVAMSANDVIGRVAGRCEVPPATVHLQERHLCQAVQEEIFARVAAGKRAAFLQGLLGVDPGAKAEDPVAVQDMVRSHLMKLGKPAFVPETFITLEEAITLILELGGIPCYPVLADGVSPLSPFEETPEVLIENLRALGIGAAEFIPTRNSAAVLEQYVVPMRRAGLIVSGGTEHNSLDRIPLTPGCKGGTALPENVREIFQEGACAIVGHQACGAADRTGYIEKDGTPAADREDRIRQLAIIGAHLSTKGSSHA